MRDTNVTSVYFATILHLTPLTDAEGFPWDDLCKILHGSQRMATVQNGEIISKLFHRH